MTKPYRQADKNLVDLLLSRLTPEIRESLKAHPYSMTEWGPATLAALETCYQARLRVNYQDYRFCGSKEGPTCCTGHTEEYDSMADQIRETQDPAP